MRDSIPQLREALRAACGDAGPGALLAHLGFNAVRGPSPVAAGGLAACVVERGADDASDPGAPLEARIRREQRALGVGPRLWLGVERDPPSLLIGTFGLDGRFRSLRLDPLRPRESELEALAELAPRPGDGPVALLARHARSLDRSAVSRRFFRDFRAQRDAVAAAWIGLPARERAEREQLALLFLCRLMFLYFLQRQGHLCGRPDYLVGLLRAWSAQDGDVAGSFYRARLRPLFFGALNRRWDDRDAAARAMGALPYLNGGLFDRHAIERERPELDLPDAVVADTFELLLERYRFTSAEGAGEDGRLRIQPEMLGRVFEGLMASEKRGATGTFFTPAAVVDDLVGRALQGYLAGRPGMDWRAAGLLVRERAPAYGAAVGSAVPARLRDVGAVADSPLAARLRDDVAAMRVLDPACGSGAFLMGALRGLTRLRSRLGDRAADDALRRAVVATSLNGVDVQADAALLCALRLWLALAGGTEPVRPLPNLDRQIRQGDALLDPLDLALRGHRASPAWRAAALDPAVRRARRAVVELSRRYAAAEPDGRGTLGRRLTRAERRLARRWLTGCLRRIERETAEHRAVREATDLFGRGAAGPAPGEEGLRAARDELMKVQRRLTRDRELPFFSFPVHFAGGADGGFDVVVSNPPWVRSHRWPRATGAMIRSRFRVCGAEDGAAQGAVSRLPAGGQVDLAMLFLERSLDLLRPDGVCAMLLPAKTLRSLSAGRARELMLGEAAPLLIEDRGLDQRAVFEADAFTAAFVLRKRATPGSHSGDVEPRAAAVRAASIEEPVRVALHRRHGRPLRFALPAAELALLPDDPRSPWLIAPAGVRRAIGAMREAGLPLVEHEGVALHRGVMTGANELLVFSDARARLGGLVEARSTVEAAEQLLEADALCPLVRGTDLRAYRYEVHRHVAWCHDATTAEPRHPPPRMAAYLERHRAALRRRSPWREGLPDGVLGRVSAATLGHRVAWRDLAPRLEAVWLPATARSGIGCERPLIPLNTVYFVPVPEPDALVLAAFLNALPARVMTRAIAERAKDARFRFFAWVVGLVPLPTDWRGSALAAELRELSREAHARRGADRELRRRIDDVACAMLSLDPRDRRALRRFDRWLDDALPRPKPTAHTLRLEQPA